MPDLWHEFGDIARQVRLKLIDRIAGENAVVREQPTPLEAALDERIAANWLHRHYIEATNLQALGGLTWDGDEAHRKRVERAERRYLCAIKTWSRCGACSSWRCK